jgi:ATP-binding protein involved in chromosome partitioning
MTVNEQALHGALQAVIDPNTGKDFVSTKQLKNLRVSGADVAFSVELGYPAKSQLASLTALLTAAAKTVPGVASVAVDIGFKVVPHAVQRGVHCCRA